MRVANWIAAVMLLLAVTTTAPARAGDAAMAETLFEEAMALMDQGEHEKACETFAASMKAEPSGGTALNLGRCSELLGKTASAWTQYKRAATLLWASDDAERAEFAQERAAAIEPKLSTLTINVTVAAGLEIERNGVAVAGETLGSAVVVDPGEHTIVVSAPGHERWSTTVRVGVEGDSKSVDVPALTPLPEKGDRTETSSGPAPEPDAATGEESNAVLVAGGVLLGVGAAAAVVGGVLGGLVLGDASDAEAVCGQAHQCDTSDPLQVQALADVESAKTNATAANVLIGVGAGVAATGIVLMVVHAVGGGDVEPESGALQLLPNATPDGAAVHLVGRF